jgi:hypothetical protein
VPAEVERLRRRLGRRDAAFLSVVAAALIVASIAAVLASGRHGPAGRCIQYNHPNFTGGATYTYCGARARVFCRGRTARSAGLLPRCAELGFTRSVPIRGGRP